MLPVVELLTDARNDLEAQAWRDRHISGVEQAMHVAPQENAVGRLVRGAFGIGPDMRRFESTFEIFRLMVWIKGFVVIRRPLSQFSSKPLPGSGQVVEHSFAWILKPRRLTRDYEQLTRIGDILFLIPAAVTLVSRSARTD